MIKDLGKVMLSSVRCTDLSRWYCLTCCFLPLSPSYCVFSVSYRISAFSSVAEGLSHLQWHRLVKSFFQRRYDCSLQSWAHFYPKIPFYLFLLFSLISLVVLVMICPSSIILPRVNQTLVRYKSSNCHQTWLLEIMAGLLLWTTGSTVG